MSSQEVLQARAKAEKNQRELEEAILAIGSPREALENYIKESASKLGVELIGPAMDAFEKKPVLMCVGAFSAGLLIGAFLSRPNSAVRLT